MIIHREYMDASSSTFIIYKDRVEVTNANNPHGSCGLLLPDNFAPFPKNPLIAKFFIQLGRVDELGSGILNVYHYLKDYSPGREPQFIEDKLFKTIVPVGATVKDDITTKSIRDRDLANAPVDAPVNAPLNAPVNDVINDAIIDAVSSPISINVGRRITDVTSLSWYGSTR